MQREVDALLCRFHRLGWCEGVRMNVIAQVLILIPCSEGEGARR